MLTSVDLEAASPAPVVEPVADALIVDRVSTPSDSAWLTAVVTTACAVASTASVVCSTLSCSENERSVTAAARVAATACTTVLIFVAVTPSILRAAVTTSLEIILTFSGSLTSMLSSLSSSLASSVVAFPLAMSKISASFLFSRISSLVSAV